MRRSVRTTIASSVLTAVLLAGVWLVLAPTQLGGSVSYAVIRGISMEPLLERGDLAVLRRSDAYEVGDVVAYESPQLHRIVLHRIVRKTGDRYQFKGDNNDFPDSGAPERVRLVGKLWFGVPLVGNVVAWVREPVHAALVTGLMALFLLGGFGFATEGRPRSRPAPKPSAAPVETILLGSAAAALVCALVAALAFARPVTDRVAVPGQYVERGSFSYATPAPQGPVYPSGQVLSGDTVFVRVVPEVPLRFTYRLTGPDLEGVSGRAKLVATLRGENGWTRRLLLAPETGFTGSTVALEGTLRLRELLALGSHVQGLTGTRTDGYALAVMPEIRVRGRVSGEALSSRFAPALDFRLDEGALRLDTDGAHSLQRARPGTGTRERPAMIGLLGLRTRVDVVRPAALAGLVAALIALAWALRAQRRHSRSAEQDRIAAELGDTMVDVVPGHRPPQTVVDVASMDGLVRLAERYGRLILREQVPDGHVYVVDDDGLRYRYVVAQPAPPRRLRPTVVDDEAPTLHNIGG